MGRWVSPDRVLLVAGLVAGVLAVFGRTPWVGVDEPAHFLRAYQISEGGLLAQRLDGLAGGYMPGELGLRGGNLIPGGYPPGLDRERADGRVFLDFRNTALYSPVPYLPQAALIGIGRAFHLPPDVLLLLARLAGLAAGIVLGVLAVRAAPVGKWLFVVLTLAPMSVRQMTAVTADTLTNGAAFLWTALCLRLAFDPDARPRGRLLWSLALCALVLTLSKEAYLPMLLLLFLGPATARGEWRARGVAFAVIAGISLVALAGWTLASHHLYLPQRISPDADPAAQLRFVLAHPLVYAGTLQARLLMLPLRDVPGALGSRLVPRPYVLAYLLLLVAATCHDGVPRLAFRIRLAIVCALTVVSVATMNYLAWNSVGASEILHFQGRYYTPILPAGFLIVANGWFASLRRRELVRVKH